MQALSWLGSFYVLPLDMIVLRILHLRDIPLALRRPSQMEKPQVGIVKKNNCLKVPVKLSSDWASISRHVCEPSWMSRPI